MENAPWLRLDRGVGRDLPLPSCPQVTPWLSLSTAPSLLPTHPRHGTEMGPPAHPPEASPGVEKG